MQNLLEILINLVPVVEWQMGVYNVICSCSASMKLYIHVGSSIAIVTMLMYIAAITIMTFASLHVKHYVLNPFFYTIQLSTLPGKSASLSWFTCTSTSMQAMVLA